MGVGPQVCGKASQITGFFALASHVQQDSWYTYIMYTVFFFLAIVWQLENFLYKMVKIEIFWGFQSPDFKICTKFQLVAENIQGCLSLNLAKLSCA